MPRLLEGLPHHFDRNLSTEKQRADAKEMHGYWFYTSAVAISDMHFQEISSILEADGSLQKWTGEKLCDGFHPDWLIRCSGVNGTVTYLICFGCHEAMVFADGTETRYDLSPSAYAVLEMYLKEKRINRPETKVISN